MWVLAAVLFASPAEANELHWTALEVDARLESDGTLAVSELQRMVFTGDWNGGERTFRLFAGQRVEVDRISRLDRSTGQSIELRRGDLDEVDEWKRFSPTVVRWRSRQPGDPPFDGTAIDYRLDYRLTGALRRAGEQSYRLDHDFAFSDREGVIERVVVRLSLAPEWRASAALPVSWEVANLAPGQGFVVPIGLDYVGDAPPANAVPARLATPIQWAAVGLFAGAILYFFGRFRRRDGALGRFDGATPVPVDRAWFESRLLPLAPELVGAAWDRKVAGAEVAAVLARLTAEGKLASEVKTSGKWVFQSQDLHLRLLVDRATFSDVERPLIDALFGASDTTDTKSVRERYKGTGFDPASKIRAKLEESLRRIRGFEAGSPKPSWKPTALLFLGALVLHVAAFVMAPDQRALIFLSLLPMTVSGVFFGMISALVGQGRVGRFFGPAIGILLALTLHGVAIFAVSWWPGSTLLHVGGALLWATAFARAIFNVLSTRESAESLARRRELARARDWLEAELRKPHPELDDRWFPYLLAFGLAPNVDRWFRRFGAESHASTWTSGGGGFSGGSSGGGGSGGGFTGGGGAFGGGGATASWALAATAMSAGVASPSSSGGSGGGGGGGGGSSGGGGGGGW